MGQAPVVSGTLGDMNSMRHCVEEMEEAGQGQKFCSCGSFYGQYALKASDGSDSKKSACNAEDPGSIPGSGRSPEERNSNPLQYSCLENPMDRGAWRAIVYRVTKSWTLLSD